ncbi:MAG: DUF6572 domain-containing protein [Terrimicrobiaceae bacterium]|nr:DUF6572 domain-containing protein [Terrimicrobiaceae bacterium]
MVPDKSLTARPMGLSHPGVLDAFAYDSRRDILVLAMYETRPWTGSEDQLFQLQEKLNAYASFVLDGEMAESFPQFVGKRVEFQLRTVHEPGEVALRLLAQAREQLALQDILIETVQIDPGETAGQSSPSEHSCSCGGGGCS